MNFRFVFRWDDELQDRNTFFLVRNIYIKKVCN